MEVGGDDDHLDEKSCQPMRASKKLKRADEDIHHQSQEIDQNPFQIQVILDVVFKILRFEDVKKFRLISSTWNQVGSSELSKRPQKPIMFHDLEELGQDDKLGQLIQLQKSHKDLFGVDHQLFSNFSINIALLYSDDQVTSPLFDNFFEFFKPLFVELYGSLCYLRECTKKELNEGPLPHILSKFLAKISPTIQEILFNNFDIEFIKMNSEKVIGAIAEELTRTKFPNLRKIDNFIHKIDVQKMFFYPIIGQNSPKLNHLKLYDCFLGTVKSLSLDNELTKLKALLESSGLISKLKILELLDVRTYILDILADFGLRGLLKLSKLNYHIDDNVNSKSEQVNNIFVRLITSQGESLKFLKIYSPRTLNYYPSPDTIRIPYPRLQNLTILQIDSFSIFQAFFQPINFSLQFPKLEEFRTFDFDTFYDQGECGDSVKFVSFLKQESTSSDYERYFDMIYEIFPNLEFLQVYRPFLPVKLANRYGENTTFWSRLRKLWIHCNKLEDLCDFDSHLEFLKDVKKIEIVMDCGHTLAFEDSYKKTLADEINNGPWYFDYLRREKLYQRCLKSISQKFSSIIHATSISFIGYKISEDFKRDFRSIFPDCTFASCQFKSTQN